MAKLAIPTVHLNGTSAGELVDQLCDAVTAIRAAEKTLANACPNGRDYYPQGADAVQEALRQHANRLHHLRAVRDELDEIAETIVGLRNPEPRTAAGSLD